MSNLAALKPQNYTTRHGKAAYVGVVCERLIVSYKNWIPSNVRDNIVFDIDARDSHGTTFSLKTGTANERTNRLAFELEYEDASGNVYPSWYVTSKAHYYVFGFHNTLLYIDRAELHRYVDAYGWDCVLRPHAETLAANQKNHVAKSCRNGIMSPLAGEPN